MSEMISLHELDIEQRQTISGIQIVNVKFDKRPEVVYVGQRMPGRNGSPLGNPYKPGQVDDAIEMFRQWLWRQLQTDTPAHREIRRLAEMYANEKPLILGCWCAPHPCHAQIIKSAIEWYATAKLATKTVGFTPSQEFK